MTEATTLTPLQTLAAVAVTSAAALTPAIGEAHPKSVGVRTYVRIRSTVDCCIAFSDSLTDDPVATDASMELGANQHEYFDVLVGSKISVKRAPSADADGLLKVTLCAKR